MNIRDFRAVELNPARVFTGWEYRPCIQREFLWRGHPAATGTTLATTGVNPFSRLRRGLPGAGQPSGKDTLFRSLQDRVRVGSVSGVPHLNSYPKEPTVVPGKTVNKPTAQEHGTAVFSHGGNQ